MFHCLLWLIVVLNLPIGAPTTTTTPSSLISSNDIPSISHLLVYASNLETVILFEPKHGWELSDETKIRLYITGHNLQNSSLAFSAFQDDCSPNEFISSIYPLSSAPVIQLDVILKKSPRGRSSTYLCLLTPASLSASSNNNSVQNMTQLTGPYYTFVREPSRLPFAAKICLILMLFIVSGFFSGLNLGLMSLSVNDLRLIAESEDTSLRYYAKRVLPLRKRGNFLLCSIVLANVLVNSLGTVLLDSLVHGLFAVIGSTIMIVLMGEIIPQAICSRYGLVIGAHTHVITWACMIITGVISYPLGFILDKILGQEVTASYTRDQIAGMLTRISADIEKPELDVITGVLSLRKKTVKEAMTWLPDVYMLDKDRKTDAELLLDVHKHGFSRIPVYAIDKSNVIGIVKLRDFALITPEQYHLTVKHLMEFHTHPFGYAKTTDSLYNLMQEFLKSQWHIALVQELRNEEDNVDPIFQTVGLITLEDVIEEMLQREIIEEADFFTDNRRKIRRKRAKTMDYTALVKRPMKGPTINPQLKVAVFQFLSTNVHQFTSGFISPEILKPLLNYNIYAMIKRPPSQSSNSIYLYKKGFRYELFTLVMQGNATLESGAERIMSTVGPFSFFGGAALASEETTVKDIQLFLDRLLGSKSKSNVTNIPATTTATTTDELSPTFMPDYNLIVNTELQVMQIHRLVWLAAVRATQRQRGNDPQFRRMPPEQLLSNALDEIVALVAHVPIDKNNLTNFQRVVNEKELAHHHSKRANGNALPRSGQQSSSVFEVIHSLSSGDAVNSVEVNPSQETNVDENQPSNLQDNERLSSSAVFICNPLLLSIPSYEQTNGNGTNNGNYHHSSSNSSDPNENGFNSSMHINRMFDEENEQMNEVEEHEHLIAQGRSANDMSNIWDLPTTSTPASPYPLQYARSDTNLVITISPDAQDETIDNENQLRTRNRRARSMLSSTKCSPS